MKRLPFFVFLELLDVRHASILLRGALPSMPFFPLLTGSLLVYRDLGCNTFPLQRVPLVNDEMLQQVKLVTHMCAVLNTSTRSSSRFLHRIRGRSPSTSPRPEQHQDPLPQLSPAPSTALDAVAAKPPPPHTT